MTLSNGGGVEFVQSSNFESQNNDAVAELPRYWKTAKDGSLSFDFNQWFLEFQGLEDGLNSDFTKITEPVRLQPRALELLKHGALNYQAELDDLTGMTKTKVLGRMIGGIVLEEGKVSLIKASNDYSIDQRRQLIPDLKLLCVIAQEFCRLRNGNPGEFVLSDEDIVRFILYDRQSHGTHARYVRGILEKGLVVDRKRNTNRVQADKADNIQFSIYDTLRYTRGDKAVTIIFKEGAKLDDDLERMLDMETAIEKGIVRDTEEGCFFTAEPELVVCRTAEGKRQVLESLADLDAKRKEELSAKIITEDELIQTQ